MIVVADTSVILNLSEKQTKFLFQRRLALCISPVNSNLKQRESPKWRRPALVLTLAIFCLWGQSIFSAEPIYDGKTLSEWLVTKSGHPSEDAIRQIGTNGIPTLIDILGIRDKNTKAVLAKLKSEELKQEFTNKSANLEDLRSLAVDGFAILGTNAESAVPQLTKMFNRRDETLFQTIRALTKVGPKGMYVLTNSMNNSDERVRNNLIWVLGEEGGNGPAITQILVDGLKDSNFANRGNAAEFLAGKDPDVAIPALIPMLDDTGYYPRARAAIALGRFGPSAKRAGPKLLSLYTNIIVESDRKEAFDLGDSFLDALREVDQESAEKAENFIVTDGPLGVAGFGWTETLLPNGKILIAGGSFQTTVPNKINHVFSRAELFDPATGKRTKTGSMNVAREGHVATLLHNGKVLVAGGDSGSMLNALSSAELYDPSSGQWAKTGLMNSPHPNEKAILQPNGTVRVSGYIGDYSKRPDDDLYDPATEKWTTIPK
jgi:hypothetical protein